MTTRLYHYLFCFWLCFSLSAVAEPAKHQAAIASAHPLATQAGMEILQQGGNAFDAAIAVSAAIAVVEPAGSGFGGGGFWLLHRAEDGFQTMIDGRETAPAKAHRDMYLNQDGSVNKTASLNGPLSAAIPGMPAALVHLAEHYGQLPLSTSLAPAINYAKEGFAVSKHYQKLAKLRLKTLQQYRSTASIFLDEQQIPEVGQPIIQHDLANTIIKLAEQGHQGFYQGNVAEKLVKSVQKHGGIWSLDDLKNYQIKERAPVKFSYEGYQITSAALPSSGGIVIALILQQLASLDNYKSADEAQKRHLIVEAMRRAYFDRSRFLGDSDFIDVPTTQLLSRDYAMSLAKSISVDQATPSNSLNKTPAVKGEDTTHFSIIDSQGNRVAATLSINYPFGSGFVAEGTGVLLNDEMDDFSAQIGVANAYGLVGNEANAIAANKRPLSSMSPSFVENDEKLMVIGTPGGSRIITMVLNGILGFIDGKPAQSIVKAPRYHHQYLPDAIQVENQGFTEKELNALRQRGHTIKQLKRQFGNMQVVTLNKLTGDVDAASDPRGEGLALIH
jgi:gamma-glutamyltranspeptidase/glutathione hydrolase